MADFSTLIASIEATIKENGVQAITGQVLQDELLLMVNAINQLKQDTLEGYAFYGEPLPNGATRVVTQNTFFLAGAGSYTINGNAVTIADGGISVIVYDCVNDEITTYLLFAYDANPTNGSANAVTSGGVKSALDTKADKNGASPDLFAGFAGNLVDTRSAGTRQGPFAFRQSGGDGVNYMRKILGRTEAFNQLVQKSWLASGEIKNAVTFTNNNDGSLSTSGTASTNTEYAVFTTSKALVDGHKYFIKGCPSGGSGSTYFLNAWVNNSITLLDSDYGSGILVTWQSSYVDINLYITIKFGEAAPTQRWYPQIIDLTLLGLGDLTAAQFEALHPLPYYNYNAGVLKNNAATGLETTGFNLWDEEIEDGAIGTDGQPITLSVYFRSKNFIPCFPSTNYYFKDADGDKSQTAFFYDADGNFISYTTAAICNTIFITPANCYKMKFCRSDKIGYSHSICINLSDASRNGTYEPYWKREIVLGLNNLPCHDENNNAVVVNGLDGVGTSQDELVVENGWGTKIIKRRGRRAYQAGDESDATLMTDGTNTDYPLATPKVLTLDNPIPALIEVDNLGTEKRLPEDTADNPQAPFECDSNYSISTANLIRKLSE